MCVLLTHQSSSVRPVNAALERKDGPSRQRIITTLGGKMGQGARNRIFTYVIPQY